MHYNNVFFFIIIFTLLLVENTSCGSDEGNEFFGTFILMPKTNSFLNVGKDALLMWSADKEQYFALGSTKKWLSHEEAWQAQIKAGATIGAALLSQLEQAHKERTRLSSSSTPVPPCVSLEPNVKKPRLVEFIREGYWSNQS